MLQPEIRSRSEPRSRRPPQARRIDSAEFGSVHDKGMARLGEQRLLVIARRLESVGRGTTLEAPPVSTSAVFAMIREVTVVPSLLVRWFLR